METFHVFVPVKLILQSAPVNTDNITYWTVMRASAMFTSWHSGLNFCLPMVSNQKVLLDLRLLVSCVSVNDKRYIFFPILLPYFLAMRSSWLLLYSVYPVMAFYSVPTSFLLDHWSCYTILPFKFKDLSFYIFKRCADMVRL